MHGFPIVITLKIITDQEEGGVMSSQYLLSVYYVASSLP